MSLTSPPEPIWFLNLPLVKNTGMKNKVMNLLALTEKTRVPYTIICKLYEDQGNVLSHTSVQTLMVFTPSDILLQTCGTN